MAKQILSDADFESIRTIFEKNNPELADDRAEIEKRFGELHAEIVKLMEERPQDWEAAVKILLQGRNFFARYLGHLEMEVSFEEPAPEVAEIEKKHVAVYVAGHRENDPFYLAVKKVLGLFKDSLRYRCYGAMQELQVALLGGEICGIVAFQTDRSGNIEGHIRHDLKNLPDWDYARAAAFVLPPCADFSPIHDLIAAIETIRRMQKGEFLAPVVEAADAPVDLPALVPHMRIPGNLLAVSIVDDDRGVIAGIEAILKAWPNLRVTTHIQAKRQLPHQSAGQADILLLDESLDGLTGTRCFQYFRDDCGFRGVAASITGGDKPEFTPWHFGNKNLINKEAWFARDFVKFMNRLIAEAEQRKG